MIVKDDHFETCVRFLWQSPLREITKKIFYLARKRLIKIVKILVYFRNLLVAL